MKNLDEWMRGRMTGRMDGKDDNQGYYISRKKGTITCPNSTQQKAMIINCANWQSAKEV
jgi:hypothetical protein